MSGGKLHHSHPLHILVSQSDQSCLQESLPLPLHHPCHGQHARVPVVRGQLAHQCGVGVPGPGYHCVHPHQGVDSVQLHAGDHAGVPDGEGGAGDGKHVGALREKDAGAYRTGLLLGHTVCSSGIKN